MSDHAPAPASLELDALLDPTSLAAVAEELRSEIAHCRSRNLKEEGIEMFLVLEDLGGSAPPRSGSSVDSALLATLARLALRAQQSSPDADIGPAEIAAAFEVLARRYFLLTPERVKAAEAGRPTSAEAAESADGAR